MLSTLSNISHVGYAVRTTIARQCYYSFRNIINNHILSFVHDDECSQMKVEPHTCGSAGASPSPKISNHLSITL